MLFSLLFIGFILIVFFQFSKYHSASSIFLFILLFTSIGAVLISKYPSFEEVIDVWNFIFVCALIYIMALGYRKYTYINYVVIENHPRFKLFANIVLLCSIFSIIINGAAFSVAAMVVEDIGAFKSDTEGSIDFYYTQVPIPHFFISLSSFFTAFSYFCLPLHFYYLLVGNIKNSMISLLASTSLIFGGLLYFSRSSFILFALQYISFLYLFHMSLAPKVKKVLSRVLLITSAVAVVGFIAISLNRFGEDKYESYIPSGSIVQNGFIFSFLDYGCMWFKSCFEILRAYDFESQGCVFSNTLFNFFFLEVDTTLIKQAIFPEDLWATFIGLFCVLVYDMGYLGAFVLCTLICILANTLSPRKGKIKMCSLFAFSIFYTLPLMSFCGSYLETLSLHFAMVILLCYKGYVSLIGKI